MSLLLSQPLLRQQSWARIQQGMDQLPLVSTASELEMFKKNCKMNLPSFKRISLPEHPQVQGPAWGLPMSPLTETGARRLKTTEGTRYLQSRSLFFEVWSPLPGSSCEVPGFVGTFPALIQQTTFQVPCAPCSALRSGHCGLQWDFFLCSPTLGISGYTTN